MLKVQLCLHAVLANASISMTQKTLSQNFDRNKRKITNQKNVFKLLQKPPKKKQLLVGMTAYFAFSTAAEKKLPRHCFQTAALRAGQRVKVTRSPRRWSWPSRGWPRPSRSSTPTGTREKRMRMNRARQNLKLVNPVHALGVEMDRAQGLRHLWIIIIIETEPCVLFAHRRLE